MAPSSALRRRRCPCRRPGRRRRGGRRRAHARRVGDRVRIADGRRRAPATVDRRPREAAVGRAASAISRVASSAHEPWRFGERAARSASPRSRGCEARDARVTRGEDAHGEAHRRARRATRRASRLPAQGSHCVTGRRLARSGRTGVLWRTKRFRTNVEPALRARRSRAAGVPWAGQIVSAPGGLSVALVFAARTAPAPSTSTRNTFAERRRVFWCRHVALAADRPRRELVPRVGEHPRRLRRDIVPRVHARLDLVRARHRAARELLARRLGPVRLARPRLVEPRGV